MEVPFDSFHSIPIICIVYRYSNCSIHYSCCLFHSLCTLTTIPNSLLMLLFIVSFIYIRLFHLFGDYSPFSEGLFISVVCCCDVVHSR